MISQPSELDIALQSLQSVYAQKEDQIRSLQKELARRDMDMKRCQQEAQSQIQHYEQLVQELKVKVQKLSQFKQAVLQSLDVDDLEFAKRLSVTGVRVFSVRIHGDRNRTLVSLLNRVRVMTNTHQH
jgi:chromosome segregation ATPase